LLALNGYALAMAAEDDDTKRKFREALDRKNAQATAGEQHKDKSGKQSRTHGPADHKREFRRKSG